MKLQKVLASVFVVALVAVSLALFQPVAASAGEKAGQGEFLEQSLCQDTGQALQGEQVARRGCCSHHKGVCGCVDGRIKCCDGTLSPTCTCLREDTVLTN